VHAKGYVLRDKAGQALHMIGVLRDLSPLRESEIKLKELNRNVVLQAEALANSNRELEQFAYSASHDLQEPLRMVISFISKLEKNTRGLLMIRANNTLDLPVMGQKICVRLFLICLIFQGGRLMEDKEDIDVSGLIHESMGYCVKN